MLNFLRNKDLKMVNGEGPPREFILQMRQLKEFKDVSEVALTEIFKQAEIIRLTNAKDDVYVVEDHLRMDFIYLFSGQCRLYFEVQKYLHQEERIDPNSYNALQGDAEVLRAESENIKTLPQKLQDMLIKPYFQTEISEDDITRQFKDFDPESLSQALSYLKDSSTESDKILVSFPFNESHAISYSTIDDYKPNYDSLFESFNNIVSSQLSLYPLVPPPHRIIGFTDRLKEIRSTETISYLIKIPYAKMRDGLDSFWRNYDKFAQIIYDYLPLIETYTEKQKSKVVQLFKEEHFFPKQTLFKEGDNLGHIYLIAEGEIKLTARNNPFTKRYYQYKKLLPNSDSSLLHNAAGISNISKTVVQSNIGILSKGQWLGEENILTQMPILYTAVAQTHLKVLKIATSDFQSKLPSEVKNALEQKTLEKMEWIRDRLEKVHNSKREIAKMHIESETYEQTINHVQQNYPYAGSQMQRKLRTDMLGQASQNPTLSLLIGNSRVEKKRELEEEKTGQKSLKTILLQQERIKAIKKKMGKSIINVMNESSNLNLKSNLFGQRGRNLDFHDNDGHTTFGKESFSYPPRVMEESMINLKVNNVTVFGKGKTFQGEEVVVGQRFKMTPMLTQNEKAGEGSNQLTPELKQTITSRNAKSFRLTPMKRKQENINFENNKSDGSYLYHQDTSLTSLPVINVATNGQNESIMQEYSAPMVVSIFSQRSLSVKPQAKAMKNMNYHYKNFHVKRLLNPEDEINGGKKMLLSQRFMQLSPGRAKKH